MDGLLDPNFFVLHISVQEILFYLFATGDLEIWRFVDLRVDVELLKSLNP